VLCDIAVVVDEVPDDYLSAVALLWKLGRTVSHDIEPVLLADDFLPQKAFVYKDSSCLN